jgi:hypothetical protein
LEAARVYRQANRTDDAVSTVLRADQESPAPLRRSAMDAVPCSDVGGHRVAEPGDGVAERGDEVELAAFVVGVDAVQVEHEAFGVGPARELAEVGTRPRTSSAEVSARDSTPAEYQPVRMSNANAGLALNTNSLSVTASGVTGSGVTGSGGLGVWGSGSLG